MLLRRKRKLKELKRKRLLEKRIKRDKESIKRDTIPNKSVFNTTFSPPNTFITYKKGENVGKANPNPIDDGKGTINNPIKTRNYNLLPNSIYVLNDWHIAGKKKLTPIQEKIYILNRQGMKQSDIAKELNRTQQSISVSLRFIEKKGYIIKRMYLTMDEINGGAEGGKEERRTI